VMSRSAQFFNTRRVLRSHGVRGVMTLRRLYATQGELAYEKRRLLIRQRRRPDEATADQLRAQIASLRATLGGSDGGTTAGGAAAGGTTAGGGA
jgi:hypothetical protein